MLVVLIAADEPPPSEAGRQAIVAGYNVMKKTVRAGVLVVEGEAFWAAAKRSVITLINLSPVQPIPLKVASNASEGAIKLAKLLGPALDARLDPERIAEAALHVRSQWA